MTPRAQVWRGSYQVLNSTCIRTLTLSLNAGGCLKTHAHVFLTKGHGMGANMAYFQYEITGCIKLCVKFLYTRSPNVGLRFVLIVTLVWCVLGYKAPNFCGFLTCRCCTYSYHGYIVACTPNSIGKLCRRFAQVKSLAFNMKKLYFGVAVL